jgi:hypothetical protein
LRFPPELNFRQKERPGKIFSILLIGVTVVRIAVWDTVVEEGRSTAVKEALAAPSNSTGAVFAALVRKRACL